MYRNRREFLKGCCGLGAAGIAAHLNRLGPISAYAQAGSTYKALVCIFLFGGNDSNNTVVPIDSRYAAYQAMRGPVALAQGSLLQAGGSGYGFHPALVNVQRIYNLQRAAVLFNVGTLFRPTTRATLNSTPLPRNLFSHSDQVQQMQTSDPNGGGTGWAGRVNDNLATANPPFNTGALPPGITVSGGSSLFLSGQTTKGLNFSNAGSFGLTTFGERAAMDARIASLQKVLTFDSGLRLVSAANGILTESFASVQAINAALNSAPALPVAFPNSGLGQQLAQVMQIILARGALGMQRQVFFASMGGFDNHENLLGNQQGLLATVDAAINAFHNALEATGLLGDVTLFTESDFNRTGNSNANVGTDHGWGSHHIIIGGAVRGGTTYGTFPIHELRGPDDSGTRGNWIPSTSLDQYAATLATWFGVDSSALPTIFPNIVNWAEPQRNLGFMA
jgi:uncharacterized protein (DUF1501 family)